MNQTNKYTVTRLNLEQLGQLNTEDSSLISTYSVGSTSFVPNKYQVDLNFYTLSGEYLETVRDIRDYTILGADQTGVVSIAVRPVENCEKNGYLGDVQVEYVVTNNLFSPSHFLDADAELFIKEISSDRTEIRASSLSISEEDLQKYAQDTYNRLNGKPYFYGINLSFQEESILCTNILTEVIDDRLLVAFKLYEPLPAGILEKAKFKVVEQIGDPARFEVIRTVELSDPDDDKLWLKGPNFGVEPKNGLENGTVTKYLNYVELFSYPELNNRTKLYSIYNEQGIELGIDHNEFSNFVHFSSATERLENFRYKLELLQTYEQESSSCLDSEKVRLSKLINGIIGNFDHYERFLYYVRESENSWPKGVDGKPYPVSDPVSLEWFRYQYDRAKNYDENNPDILINSIPGAIRQDPRNEAYLIFVHMIGQHFDNDWLYAKAVSDRYSGDNRLDFGLPKDLVKEALTGFGIRLNTTNQNLEKLFEACVPGKPYNKGTELCVNEFLQITSGSLVRDDIDKQPVFVEDYRKEMYKRLYHNVPLLLKTKGTTRGLRALISCFGIPESVLEISVRGGDKKDSYFLGPRETTEDSVDRIRLDVTGSFAPARFEVGPGFEPGTGNRFVTGSAFSLDRSVINTEKDHFGTQETDIGFRLNKPFDIKALDLLVNEGGINYDNIIGDPGNTEENYGNTFSNIFQHVVGELSSPQGIQLRTPTAILRLIRYFDSALFRTLESFVPARDNVSTGAIVDDNILHRNRYKGVVPKVKDIKQNTGEVQTVYIDGGEGGCMVLLRQNRPSGKPKQVQNFVLKSTNVSRETVTVSRECPITSYQDKVSTGASYVDKPIFDEAPRFNGELCGTETAAETSEDLMKRNKIRHGGDSIRTMNYDLDFRFLCLPRPETSVFVEAVGYNLASEFHITIPTYGELRDMIIRHGITRRQVIDITDINHRI